VRKVAREAAAGFGGATRENTAYPQILEHSHPALGHWGESWHVPSEHVVCYKVPCNAKFCQKCGKHGHVRAECKVLDSEPRANKQGYWCENNKGDALKPIYRENRSAPGSPAAASPYRFGGPPGSSGRQAARTNVTFATQTTGGGCL
jgi:hypothetical protein